MKLLSDFTLNPGDWSPDMLKAAVALAIALGTLYCFLGYRTVKFAIFMTGFVLAGATGAAVAAWVSKSDTLVIIGGALVGGFAGAVALLFLYKLSVFCMGMVGALLVAHNVLSARPPEPWFPWAMLASSVLAGFAAVALERPLLTVATAVLGAWAVVCGLAFFLIMPDNPDVFETLLQPGGGTSKLLWYWVVLSVAGAAAQFATHSRKRRPPKQEQKPPP